MKSLSVLILAAIISTAAHADTRCRHNYSAGATDLEVNSTPCDHGPVAGVKAICRDGWQSFHTGAGTCSRHGGISHRVN